MSDSERSRTTEYVPYTQHITLPKTEKNSQLDAWLAVGKLVLRNFEMHEKTQYAEFIFLILGIIYFIEAIIKNTVEMLK